ncbi:MAG: metallophosphoesterase [Bacteroidia bacterium]|nr:metallophosphoesterase [Bacteroidia bacterium]
MLPRPNTRSIHAIAMAILVLGSLFPACAQKLTVPATHQNIAVKRGALVAEFADYKFEESDNPNPLQLEAIRGAFTGTDTGLEVDFGLPGLNGTLYYGFIPFGDSKHPMPVYFKTPANIVAGKASIPIKGALEGRYDMVGWASKGIGTFGYRIVTDNGSILYDGKITFTGTGPFTVAPTVIEGPLVNLVGPDSAVISFITQVPAVGTIHVGGQAFADAQARTHHEIIVRNLASDNEHEYTLTVDEWSNSYSLRTAPEAGSKTAFTFAYASDSRNGQGGGERDLYGTNFYIVKKIMALAKQQNAAFFQFSGDMINGYLTDLGEMELEYANWKRAIEPFSHYFPVYIAMGNHEALSRTMIDKEGRSVSVDRFPYATQSAEYVFGQQFTLPTNGPLSEDGQSYDPNPDIQDFPSYAENVYWYQHGNVAVVVLNSNYWYTPTTSAIKAVGGNPHAYLMDGQMEWLTGTLAWMEEDSTIDHIFMTQHTPAFPNGGHVRDDMWYAGNNDIRAWVAGKPVSKGIIERRDEYLDLMINKSSKVRAMLTGDEHNYARTEVGPETNIYPDNWFMPKLSMSRSIWQINNGAAGAPYYAQEQTPWSNMVQGFTTQNALVLFDVEGDSIKVRVLNPDTLEEVDGFTLR